MLTASSLACLMAIALGGSTSAGAARYRQGVDSPQTVRRSVTVARCTFVDASRSTFNHSTGATASGRTLITEIRYPNRPRGAYPTIFFAPGYGLDPDSYAALLDAWVASGFVVIAPIFPDTNPQAVADARIGNPESDVANQPADLAFVIRQSLEASRVEQPTCRVLDGLVEASAIGIAGQSDGGDTVAMLGFDPDAESPALTADLGLRAAVVLSGAEYGAGPYEATAGGPALLVVQSATDACNPPEEAAALYNAIAQPDKWYLALASADHLPPYDGADPSAFRIVAQVTTRFFLLELGHRSPGAGFLAFGDRAPAVARLTTGMAAPAVPDLEENPAVCYLS